MSDGTVAVLSDGREVKMDVEKMQADIKTRHDIKVIIAIAPGSDDYDKFMAKYSGLTVEEVEALSIADFKAVDRAMGKALERVISPN